MWINVKNLGGVCSTCQQVTVLPNRVDLSSRKTEVQTYRRLTSRLTAGRVHYQNQPHLTIFFYPSLKKPFDV